VSREPVLQTSEVILAIFQEMTCSAAVGVWCFEEPVLADITRAVFLVEDKVPG